MDKITTPEASKVCNHLFVDALQDKQSSIGDEWVIRVNWRTWQLGLGDADATLEIAQICPKILAK